MTDTAHPDFTQISQASSPRTIAGFLTPQLCGEEPSSVRTFRGIAQTTVSAPSSSGIVSRLARANVLSDDQNATPAFTISATACTPSATHCKRLFFARSPAIRPGTRGKGQMPAPLCRTRIRVRIDRVGVEIPT
jgi:hypothetical protein